jgi:transposase-like protein
MTYDDWKTETPEDEMYRRMGRIQCEMCDSRAHGSYEFKGIWKGVVEYLCEPCAEKREEEASKPVCVDCDAAIATVFCEDLTGHGHDQWLCQNCADAWTEDYEEEVARDQS